MLHGCIILNFQDDAWESVKVTLRIFSRKENSVYSSIRLGFFNLQKRIKVEKVSCNFNLFH